MSNRVKVPFALPPGRAVQGDFYKANDKDMQGRPLRKRDGSLKIQYFYAIAVPKVYTDPNTGQQVDTRAPVQMQVGPQVVEFPGWTQAWGKPIFAEAFGARPLPTDQMPKDTRFAWKIVDGDSPEMSGGTPPKPINQYEGFPGCWIVKFTSEFPPNLCDKNYQPLPPGTAKIGDYYQVSGTVVHNEDTGKPGVYINPGWAMLVGYGKEIAGGGAGDPRQAGFVPNAPLPPGASATPIGGLPVGAGGAPAGAPIPVPGAAAVVPPFASQSPATVAYGVPSAPAPVAPTAPVYVQPNPGILPQVPGMAAPAPTLALPPAPPAAAPVPPAAGPQLTAKAGTFTYQQLIAAGWNDATLRANGYIV